MFTDSIYVETINWNKYIQTALIFVLSIPCLIIHVPQYCEITHILANMKLVYLLIIVIGFMHTISGFIVVCDI